MDEKEKLVRQFYTQFMRDQLDSKGLKDWTCRINTNKRFLGWCKFHYKRIEISVYHCLNSQFAEVNDTILHEIAHALVGPGHNHNEVWKEKAKAIGCRGERCGPSINAPHKYSAHCPTCGRVFRRYRQLKRGRIVWCAKCGRETGTLIYKPIVT